ncbi:MAG: ATP-dependent sacrificial sulfur transferase LarE [Phycisphaerales bacterium]|nr:MAG: ATP-dependent sacrificial sulfur transferase LarE [Phycisphaerales bacterium]
MEDSLDKKHERLKRTLDELDSVAVAFSGGVDSVLLLKVAIDTLGADKVVAVTGRSSSLAKAELQHARELAKSLGAEHVILDTDEFDDSNYVSNPTDRCYFCKANLYSHMQRFIEKRGFKAIVCGTNVDDLGDFRPGIQAGREAGVHSPIAEAGLTKQDLRQLSQELGLPNFDKPANPCLSSRIQYGERVTPEKLGMIEAAEAFLHEMGIRVCRVRHHGAVARIEVPADLIPRLAEAELSASIDRYFRSLGYKYVSLDLRGFRSGSMNEVMDDANTVSGL